MVGLGFILGGAAEGLGTSIVQEAQTRREIALRMLQEDRADARAAADRDFRRSENQADRKFRSQTMERESELRSDERRQTAKLNDRTQIAQEERASRQSDIDFQRNRQTQAKVGVQVDPEARAKTTLDIFKALDPGRNRNDLAGLLGGDVGDMPDTSSMSVEERWAMAESLTERLYPSRQRPRSQGRPDASEAAPAARGGPSKNDILDDAIEVLRQGAPREQVEARLRENGIDPSRLPASPAAPATAEAALPEPRSQRREPAPSQSDRYGGEMRGDPRSREPVRGQREQGWGGEDVQGAPVDIAGAVGSAARAVGETLRPNTGGILTEEGQRRQADERSRNDQETRTGRSQDERRAERRADGRAQSAQETRSRRSVGEGRRDPSVQVPAVQALMQNVRRLEQMRDERRINDEQYRRARAQLEAEADRLGVEISE